MFLSGSLLPEYKVLAMLNVPSPGSLGEPKIYHNLVYFTREVVVGCGGCLTVKN